MSRHQRAGDIFTSLIYFTFGEVLSLQNQTSIDPSGLSSGGAKTGLQSSEVEKKAVVTVATHKPLC